MGEQAKHKHRFPPMFAGLPAWLRTGGGGPLGQGDASTGKSTAALTGQARLLLLVNGLFAAGNALSGTFVHVYLWKVKNDFALIGWFAVAQQLTMALVFWLAGKWVKEHNKMNALRAGVAVAAVFYALVLWFGTKAVSCVLLLGAVQGIASGLFWVAFNVVYFEVTGPENRDRFNGWAGLLGSGAGMVAPWVSGYLITHMSSTSGYRLIFSISLGIFVSGVIVSFFLKKRKEEGHYGWVYGFRQIGRQGNPWRRIFPAMIAQGIKEGVFGFMIVLLVYVSTKNEMKLGSFSLITSAVALFSFYLTGRFFKPAYRKWGMLIGVLAMIGVILPFFWRVNYAMLLLFGIGTSLFIPLYTVPMTSVVFDIIGRREESARHRVEYIVLREIGLNGGRLLGTLVFIAVVSASTAPLAVNSLLLGIGASPLLAWLFMRPWLKNQAA